MKVLYFAWVRQKVGVAEEVFSATPQPANVAALVSLLREKGAGHASAFADLRQIRVAVNQEFVSLDHALHPTDEVAFFPPVTGG